MLTAYIDETGHSQDPSKKYVGLAGMVATSAQWEVFEGDWRQSLEDFEIPNSFFHMTDFTHSKGIPYERWKDDGQKRKDVLGRLMGIIGSTGMSFGAVVRLDDYRATSVEFQSAMLDPYYLCLQHCVHGAAIQTLYEAPEEKINVVFADQPEYRGKIGPLYAALRESKDMREHGLRLGGHCVDKPQDLLPLQAADVIAYEVGQYFEKFAHRSDVAPRWGFLEILKMAFNGGQGMFFLMHIGKERLQQIQHERETVQTHNARLGTRGVARAEIDEMIKNLEALRAETERE